MQKVKHFVEVKKTVRRNYLEDIWGGNYTHLDIKARYSRLKIIDCIRQTQTECNGAEISAKRMGKGLNMVFKVIVKELDNLLPDLL